MSLLKTIFLTARPKTLPASLVPVWLGCIVCWKATGFWNPTLAAFTALSAICIQIACNFFNDAIDHAKGADTSERTGPRRATASGMLSSRQVYFFACLFLAGACAASLPLLEVTGWPLLIIGIPSLYLSYGYTGGPLPLAYKGLAEVFVVLFFGLVAVAGTAWIQSGYLLPAAIPVGLQCGLISAVLVSINNIRDRKQDIAAGKLTFAARFGDAKARRLVLAMSIATWVLLFQTLPLLDLQITWLWAAPILLSLFICWRVSKLPAGPKLNPLLGLTSLTLLIFAAALQIACLKQG